MRRVAELLRCLLGVMANAVGALYELYQCYEVSSPHLKNSAVLQRPQVKKWESSAVVPSISKAADGLWWHWTLDYSALICFLAVNYWSETDKEVEKKTHCQYVPFMNLPGTLRHCLVQEHLKGRRHAIVLKAVAYGGGHC